MTDKTWIKGKDSDLDSTIERMQIQLKRLGFDIEEASWLNPVPGVYSVHIHDKNCPQLFTNGKGSSKKACLASALGEFFERLSCDYFFADFYLGDTLSRQDFVHFPDERWFKFQQDSDRDQLMNQHLWQYFDPDQQLDPNALFEANSGAGERGVCALPFTQLSNQQRVYIPINILSNIYASNGMSAGNTIEEARVQALSEICERYVKHQVIAKGLCLPEIPETVIARFPFIQQSIQAIRDYGYRLRITDASLGGHYPVINVTLIDPNHGSVFASFGAHPCFEVALERTVTELLQGRKLEQMNTFHPPTFDLDEVASPENIEMHFIDSSGLISNAFFRTQADYQFVDWDWDGTTQAQYQWLSQRIEQQGFEIYYADYYHLGVPACRIIIPGMSDIYPVDELQWENNNEGAKWRSDLLNLTRLDPEQWQKLFDQLEQSGHSDHNLVSGFIGILADANSLWATIRLGEIKTMLCLALQNSEALSWVDWCLSLQDLSIERQRYYRCLKALLEIKWHHEKDYQDYLPGLAQLYQQQTLDNALSVVEAEVTFFQLPAYGLELSGFESHQSLLVANKKLRQIKQQYYLKADDH